MNRMHPTVRATLFFFPELALIALILANPMLFEVLLRSIATPIFASCAKCLASGQFTASVIIVGYCLSAHLVRFAALSAMGSDVLAAHRPGFKEGLISFVIVTAYAIFVWASLSQTAQVNIERMSAIVDVIAASVIALALVELVLSATNLVKKENPQ